MTDPTRENRIALISQFAASGVNDPDIAHLLGIKPSQVASLRRQNDIPAGERRWLPAGEPTAPVGETA